MKKIQAFIISWQGYYDSAFFIAENINNSVDALHIIYSNESDSLESGKGTWWKVPNSYFFGRKFHEALRHYTDGIFLLIHADVTCANWQLLIENCQKAFAIDQMGIWTPKIDYSFWDPARVTLTNESLPSLTDYAHIAQPDAIVVAFSQPIIKRLCELNYSKNNLGWGIDWIATCHAYANGYYVVRDEAVLVEHKQSSGYIHKEAYRQMTEFMSQMTADEAREYAHLKFFIEKNIPQKAQPKLDNSYAVLGHFINLDRSPERLSSCQQQLTVFALQNYSRLPGVNGTEENQFYPDSKYSPGKLGCWLSHLKAMEHSLTHYAHQHILEDDFIFTPVFKSFHDNFENHAKTLGDWDIIFCDIDLAGMQNVADMNWLIRRVNELEKNKKIAFEDAVKLYGAGNSSYIINKTSKQKIYSLMKEGFASGLPNDLYLRKLIREGKVKAYVTLPFVTTVSDAFNDSTILGTISSTNPSIMFATMFRQSLAWGADTRKLLDLFKKRINQLQPVGDRSMIYAHLVAHFVSDDYKPY